MKFIILDEIDYMTRTAQLALKYLIEHTNSLNVRFCLICNYISKVDSALAQNFIMFRFNSHPHDQLFKFLKNITIQEKLKLSDNTITSIINYYQSDLRSMINYIQLNRIDLQNVYITTNTICNTLIKSVNKSYKYKLKQFNSFSKNSEKKSSQIIKDIIIFIFNKLRSNKKISSDFLSYASIIYHNIGNSEDALILYLIKYIIPYYEDS